MNEHSRNDMFQTPAAKGGRAERQRLDAALIDAARATNALRDRAEQAATLIDRTDALLRSAQSAAKAKSPLLAWDCLYQIERELVVAMDDSARHAAAIVYQAESETLEPWRRFAARALVQDGEASAANLQALMRTVHEARLDRLFNGERARGQIATLAALLALAVCFVGAWGLVGGLDWVLQSEAEITLAMLLVNGMIFGFLGALLSSALHLIRWPAAKGIHDQRRSRIAAVARPFVGAVIAVPIVFVLQSGLISMGEASPIVDLLACFAGGFLERAFAAQLERGHAN